MLFLKKDHSLLTMVGMFVIVFFFSYCKVPVTNTATLPVPAAKQVAMAAIFPGSKIVRATTWKEHLSGHPQLAQLSEELKISNGFVYQINRPNANPLELLFTKDKLVIMGGSSAISQYPSKFMGESIIVELCRSNSKWCDPMIIGHNCVEDGNCTQVYHQFDTGCVGCEGNEVDWGLPGHHRVLAP